MSYLLLHSQHSNITVIDLRIPKSMLLSDHVTGLCITPPPDLLLLSPMQEQHGGAERPLGWPGPAPATDPPAHRQSHRQLCPSVALLPDAVPVRLPAAAATDSLSHLEAQTGYATLLTFHIQTTCCVIFTMRPCSWVDALRRSHSAGLHAP